MEITKVLSDQVFTADPAKFIDICAFVNIRKDKLEKENEGWDANSCKFMRNMNT